MQVSLKKAYPIPAPAKAAWKVLQDIRSVAQCMPGAEITEQLDANRYKGQVRLKIGPATAAFEGDIDVLSVDAGQMEMSMRGVGSDVKGSSGATMDLAARVRPVNADTCELVGASTITVTGKFANFGGRMMTQVADQLLKQFAENFTTRAIAAGEGVAAEEAAAKLQAQPKELNAIAMFFKLLWNMVKGLFQRGPENHSAKP